MKLIKEARSLEFAGAIGGARALIQSVPAKKGPAKVLPFPLNLAPLLELVRDLGRVVLPDWQAVLDLPDEQQTNDLLYESLARVTWIVEILGLLIRSGDALAKKGRLSARNWPQDLVREVAEVAENYEDLQETIALGLSAGFRKELESARAQVQR